MIDMAILGFSILTGVPTGSYIHAKLDKVFTTYNNNKRLRNDFKKVLEDLNINLEIREIKETEKYITGELVGAYKIYKLNILINEFCKRLGVEEGEFVDRISYIKFRFSKIKEEENHEEYNFVPLQPTTLLLGYGDKGLITSNMLKCPHMLVVGNSNSGKSYCVETALRNLRGANITLLNVFEDDFKGVTANRINDIGEIQKYLLQEVENKEKRDKPTYIVIDEYNVLSLTKGMDKLIMELLAQARHFNLYLILIAQKGNAEDIKYKGLFNTRVCFTTIEEATRKAVLGATTEKSPIPREFYMVTDKLYQGQTFTLK